jgi:uncharacterized membrane protein YeaQ/YmgE (transglycosylase-associated protein family)
MGIISFLIMLLVAAACAWIAERIVPGTIPGGFFVSAIFGLIGAWIGSSVFGSFGPSLEGVALLPCIFGTAILIFGVRLISRGMSRAKV